MILVNQIVGLKTIKAPEGALRALSNNRQKHTKKKIASSDFLSVMNFYNITKNKTTKKSPLGVFGLSDKAPTQGKGALKCQIQHQIQAASATTQAQRLALKARAKY